VFAAIAIAVGAVALVQRTDARHARTEADVAAGQAEQAAAAAEQQLLTARARDLSDDELDLALLLAVEARRRSDGADALDALATVLRAQPAIERFSFLGAAASAGLDVGADGRRGAMLDGERLVRFTLPDLSMEPPVTIPGATGLAMSPTSSQIAVTTRGGVTVYDAATGAIDVRLPVPLSVGLGPEGVVWLGPSKLGIRHADQVSVVDLDTGFDSEVVSIPANARVAIASDGSGRRLAVGPYPTGLIDSRPDSTIRIVDTTTGELIRRLEPPIGRVTDLSFQPNGDLLAVGTEDAGLYVLDTATGETVLSRSVPVGESGRFSPDGTKLAIRHGGGTVTVIEPTTGKVLLPPVIQARELRNLFFTAEADAVVADDETALVTIRLDGREPLASAPFGEPGDMAGPVSSGGEVAWAVTPPDDRLPARERDYHSVAYDPDDGRSTLTIPGVAWLYGTGDDWVYVWQRGNRDAVIDSRSGATLFTDSGLGIRQMAFVIDLRVSMIVRATFDGQYLDVRRLPDLSPIETPLRSFQWDMLTFTISTDGRRLAFATVEPSGSMMIHILDIASGDESTEPIRWPDEVPPIAMVFSADDRTLRVGDKGGGITEIDVATGTVSSSRFEAMHGAVVGLAPLDDGRLLAVSHDGTMSIYDATSGQPIGPPMAWATRVPEGVFVLPSPDLAFHHLAAPDPEGVRLWNIDPSTWPAVACQRAGRNLTSDEWTRYLPADEPYRSTCPQFPAG
jgi:WD40 repeat protein